MRRNSPRHGVPVRREQGFVLVMVLVALVVVTLLASAVAVVSERAVREARQDQDAFAGEVDAIGTRDTLLYMLATHRQTVGGLTVDDQVVLSAGQATAAPRGRDEFGAPLSQLPIGNEIRLDSTPYRGLGSAAFALQDDAGLFSINWTPGFLRDGLFTLIGVPSGEWNAMEAARLDYQDPDALHRLGGAEAGQYRERDLPPPTNRVLATPLEARRILGWGQALEGLDDSAVMGLLTAGRSVVLNVNTATSQSLQILPGVDPDTARRMIDMRGKLPYVLEWRFIRDFNLPMDEMAPIGLLPVGYGTLALWHNAGGPRRVVHWTLTPVDEGGRPWRLDYEIILPRDDTPDSSMARPTATPLLARPDQAGR